MEDETILGGTKYFAIVGVKNKYAMASYERKKE